jgi:hypothetical protein
MAAYFWQLKTTTPESERRHDIQHNGIQHDDAQHNSKNPTTLSVNDIVLLCWVSLCLASLCLALWRRFTSAVKTSHPLNGNGLKRPKIFWPWRPSKQGHFCIRRLQRFSITRRKLTPSDPSETNAVWPFSRETSVHHRRLVLRQNVGVQPRAGGTTSSSRSSSSPAFRGPIL